ncbi:uncharacterized protein At4g15545-like [Cynara cardunculus var. scolymus]|uniref:uncharacterized protein At4g15545-like n=1 Tax=Cynara cardunculus var. scolymus TaxID=59895 RepID=UPI000D62B771|nr:uncharacterized protein At4g15545-like [Cynara cardunculus var. scolymus]
MLAKETAGAAFDLPVEVLEVLPSDPFQQLDVARKITSIALSTRVSSLELESSDLRQQLADRDAVIADLNSQLDSLDSSLSQNLHKLSIADQEKENLLKENVSLSQTVNKLKRDVAKLESFRKTLMMSLQDEEGSSATAPPVVAANVQNHTSLSSQTFSGEEEETVPPSSFSSIKSQSSDVGNSYHDEHVNDASRPRVSPSLLLASQTNTPRLTPPGSPPSLSASASPSRTPKPVSPRRHSIAVSRGLYDDKSSVFSSANSSPYSSMSGRTRVDGKEFFRQVRSRLSYEQFAAFLANVKELNSQKQTKEDTLRKADEIFGPDNKDLYVILEGLITRNFH